MDWDPFGVPVGEPGEGKCLTHNQDERSTTSGDDLESVDRAGSIGVGSRQ